MVVQFGLAMIPSGGSIVSSGFTSLTTRGTCGCWRQADELSTTTAPAPANRSAWAREVVAPAENSAMSMPARSAVAVSSTTISPSPHGRVEPAERADAKKRIEAIGKSRSTSSSRITAPTWPVAPTRARFTPRAMSAPRPAVDDGFAVRVQLEGGVHGAHRVRELVRAGDDRDPDLRGRDHLDVDPGVAQRAEELRGDA